MLEPQRAWLPQFTGKALKSAPTISIPKSYQAVGVPLDPALAINHRLGKLIS